MAERAVISNTDRVFSLFREGVDAYRLVENGDHVLVAVSGGKDSLTLLNALVDLQKTRSFRLTAIHIKTDFQCSSCIHEEVLSGLFQKLDVPYLIKHIKVLDEQRRTSCFWCSWNRRKCLFETAQALGWAKIAFGHHKDDMIETTLLNMFFKGEISTMMPLQEMFDGAVKIIRPLWMVEEKMIRQFAAEHNLPHHLCRCPFGATSKRRLIKEHIAALSKEFPEVDIRGNIVKSISMRSGAVEHQDEPWFVHEILGEVLK